MTDSFDELAGADRARLEAMLASSDPIERIWATWELALRSSDDARQLASGLAREPDGGVRRTLAVVLAAHGEIALLLALAINDPDRAVREQAIGLATRQLPARLTVDELLAVAGDDREMQLAIVNQLSAASITADTRRPLVDLVMRMMRDPDAATALDGFEAALRLGFDRETRDFLVATKHFAEACERVLGVHDNERLVAMTAAMTRERRAIVLERLRAPEWALIEPLVGDDLQLCEVVASRRDIGVPARVLARLVLANRTDHGERLADRLEATRDGQSLLADVRTAIAAGDSARTAEFIASAEQFARQCGREELSVIHHEIASTHPIEALFALEHALVKWTAAGHLDAVLCEQLTQLCEVELARLANSRRDRRTRLAMFGRLHRMVSKDRM